MARLLRAKQNNGMAGRRSRDPELRRQHRELGKTVKDVVMKNRAAKELTKQLRVNRKAMQLSQRHIAAFGQAGHTASSIALQRERLTLENLRANQQNMRQRREQLEADVAGGREYIKQMRRKQGRSAREDAYLSIPVNTTPGRWGF